jgi:hypothetical protein
MGGIARLTYVPAFLSANNSKSLGGTDQLAGFPGIQHSPFLDVIGKQKVGWNGFRFVRRQTDVAEDQ